MFHYSNSTAHTQPVNSSLHFHHSKLLLAEAESPPFFSFRCNKPSSLFSSIVCISIFYPCTLLMYRSSMKLMVSLW
uniref:Uncharacterized protein n=1 Tax=Aquila chrysaetos chrysaetos TaxID=223781 RepID=A0A663EXN2_AQUCH